MQLKSTYDIFVLKNNSCVKKFMWVVVFPSCLFVLIYHGFLTQIAPSFLSRKHFTALSLPVDLKHSFSHTMVRLSQAAILGYANLSHLCGYAFYVFVLCFNQTFNWHFLLWKVKDRDSVSFSLKFLQQNILIRPFWNYNWE